MFNKKDNVEIQLGDLNISKVRPVVKGRMLTKVGRVSLRGKLNGQDVKIVEYSSREHASFAADLMSSDAVSRYFPEVHGTHDEFVVSGWQSGQKVTPRNLLQSEDYRGQLREFLDIIHGRPPAGSAGFDYVEDFIRPRFSRACRALGLADMLDRVENSWRVMMGLADRAYISHPDLSTANMIVEKNGQLKFVDNELLNVSRSPWFDEMHVVYFLGNASVSGAGSLAAFLKPLMEIVEQGHNRHLMDMWLMRMGGARFVSGGVKEVVDMGREQKADGREKMSIWRALQICFPDRDIAGLE